MNKKRSFILLLDFIIAGVAVWGSTLTTKIITNTAVSYVVIALILLLAGLVLARDMSYLLRDSKDRKTTQPPSVAALVGDREQVVRVWDLNKQIGMLIGKSTEFVDADIDLHDTEFASYIDQEHATLNYTMSGWWVEDLGSQNGTVIQRKGKDLLLAAGSPNRILPGDIILIAENTRLAIR